MNISIYIGKRDALKDPAMLSLVAQLQEGGCSVDVLYEGDRLENAPDIF